MTPIIVEKNRRESLRLSVDEYKGRTLLSCRLWYLPGEGEELKPGRDGWAVAIEKLPSIMAGLQRLEVEARAAGLLE